MLKQALPLCACAMLGLAACNGDGSGNDAVVRLACSWRLQAGREAVIAAGLTELSEQALRQLA